MNLAVIILAAGLGTRMKSAMPKVNHQVAGRALLAHVQATAAALSPAQLVTVLGPENEAMETPGPKIIQRERRGTGHAVQVAREALGGFEGWVLVLYGDSALTRPETLRAMLDKGEAAGADLLITGFEPADPAKYGRLVVEGGRLTRIVEFKDANEAERAIGLCNGGLMALRAPLCLSLLDQLSDDNAAEELYLTDLVALVNAAGGSCLVEICDEAELKGVNNRVELAEVEALMQQRLRNAHMLAGVTLVDPATTFFSWDTKIGQDTLIEPNQVFGLGVEIGSKVKILANCHLEGAHVGDGATIGPFARLRPGTDLAQDVKVGNFVETKKAVVEPGAKINHLSYIGDAHVGAKANIGAGTITCNYDGYNKHKTEIGAGAFIGSNSALVAPLTIGAGAIVGAGATLTKSVAEDALALTRSPQREVPGGAAKLRNKFSKS